MTNPPPERAGEAAPAAAPGVTQGPPQPPRPAPAKAALVSIAAGLTFTLLTVYVAGKGSAVPGLDEHIHRWMIARRSGASATSRAQ